MGMRVRLGVHMNLAHVGMAVPPQHHLLQHEEHQQAAEQGQADFMRFGNTRGFDGVRQQPEQRGAEQRAGRKAHQMRQHTRAHPIRHDQEHRGRQRAQQAADGGE